MDKLNISTGTIVRTICLVLALVNQVLVFTGHSVLPIEDSTVEIIVTNVATVVAAVAAWWKNNSFTKPALMADDNLKLYKQSKG